MTKSIHIEPLTREHWEQVREIYREGIASGIATFETETPTWEAWDAGHLAECRLVACADETVLGWATLSPVSSRCVYSGVAEVSVYVGTASSGRGVGSLLMEELISCSESAGYWTLQSGVFPENTASLRLHAKHGFREVGRRERIGVLHGVWKDIVFLERRSSSVGV